MGVPGYLRRGRGLHRRKQFGFGGAIAENYVGALLAEAAASAIADIGADLFERVVGDVIDDFEERRGLRRDGNYWRLDRSCCRN